MKKHFLLTLLYLCAAASAFAQGIHFESGNWKSVIDKAKKEKKLVYVDVYTTWCGPCKLLEKEIFPKQEAGEKYNKLFVNVRIDAEKGEGIALAKKYAVTGYPTHLFVDPVNETVVYRDMGATAKINEFNHHADVAIKEKNDPMTWDMYVQQHKKGKKDKAFLTAYLQKANLLKKNNDAALNDYVAQIKGKPTDSTILFLAEMMQTIDNNAMPLVAANKEMINRNFPNETDHYEGLSDGWLYGTLQKAIDQKSDAVMDILDNGRQQYFGKGKDETHYLFRAQYYGMTGQNELAKKASFEEADYLTAKLPEVYRKEDEVAFENAKNAMQAELAAMNVPEEKREETIKKNIETQPAMKHSVSSQAANRLNTISWKIYERFSKDEALVKQAMNWSSRSLELSKGLNEWPLYADTYAHLLYASGNKAEAIKLQEEAISKAKALDADTAKELEASLQKMKEGKL
jgi:thiol-disulfide isomerase/thioredoxin